MMEVVEYEKQQFRKDSGVDMSEKQQLEPTLDIEGMKKGLENHTGYPFELEIARRLAAHGYLVDPNYSFEDHDSGQARELDFHALSLVPVSTRKGEWIFFVILGSCKDNKNPYVFFTRRELTYSRISLQSDLPIAGCPLEIYEGEDYPSGLGWYLKLHEFLHIATRDIISSQFCELVWKKGKWTVQSKDIFKDVFIPLIKALSREIERQNETCMPGPDEESPQYTVYYPLVVLRGPVFEYYVPPKGPAQLREAKHILVSRHYQSRSVKCRYAIDVIHESYLHKYLNLVEKETQEFANRIKRHKKVLVQSIKRIVELEEKGKWPKLD